MKKQISLVLLLSTLVGTSYAARQQVRVSSTRHQLNACPAPSPAGISTPDGSAAIVSFLSPETGDEPTSAATALSTPLRSGQKLQLDIKELSIGQATLRLVDSNGHTLRSIQAQNGQGELNTEGLNRGTYLLIAQQDGKQMQWEIVIQA